MNRKNIVILTGAGISAESGLSTFRDNDGLWEKHRVEDVASPEAFKRNPSLVYRFYNLRRQALKQVKPNPAHLALAKLEQHHNGSVTIVTQNVDNLHEQAGSNAVLHMHGELFKGRCRTCSEVFIWCEHMDETTPCPACENSDSLRPHIVWFGEMPFYMNEIDQILSDADIFISIGTSGNVYPAAGFVAQVNMLGRAKTIELNLEPSDGNHMFNESHCGLASELVPNYVEKILRGEDF
jgi:NAD-dependent deacetylase